MSSTLFPGFDSHTHGHVFEDAGVTAFFGHRGADPDALALAFPDYTLSTLKQTHSDHVVSAVSVIRSGDPVEADAQYTNERRIALCVKTADCVPVLIHDRESGLIAAIHAGWRGVASGIITKTAKLLIAKGARLERAQAWIGPHIGPASFEVGDDVAGVLEAAFDSVRGYSNESTAILTTPAPFAAGGLRPSERQSQGHVEQRAARTDSVQTHARKHIDLLRIVRAQLVASGIERERTMECAIDTVQSSTHESYRRDQTASGRQLSFIALK